VVSCTTIKAQIIFEILFTLVVSQLAITCKLEEEVYLQRIRFFLGVGNNILEGDDLADKAACQDR